MLVVQNNFFSPRARENKCYAEQPQFHSTDDRGSRKSQNQSLTCAFRVRPRCAGKQNGSSVGEPVKRSK